ncbi:MAG: hypothetical protein Q8M29_11320 [Bacteroidota bacterium]|nr:hypothetical protein [Bacteroidota bacterium]
MKKLIAIISILFFSGITVIKAQEHHRGIYRSAEDFVSRKLSHGSKHTHIKLHEVFKKDIIEVKHNDSNYVYKKQEVFGYKENTGEEFRIHDYKFYQILNPTEKILIYKIPHGIPQKGQAQAYSYFFSKSASSSILPLTLKEIENQFAGNVKFDEFIETHFKSDGDLLEYDNIHKMYKLNRLYELSIMD